MTEFFIEMSKEAHASVETGTPLYMVNRTNLCHILPKRKYKSVALDRRNIIFLTTDEHTRFDYLLDCNDFQGLEKEFPNAWKVACERFIEMLPDVEETGKLRTLWEEYCEKRA